MVKFAVIFAASIFLLPQVSAQVPTNGLLAFYPFDGNAKDASGNGHHGVEHNTRPATDRLGNPGGALFFSNSFIEVRDTPTLRPHNFTYSFWFSMDAVLAAPTFIHKQRDAGVQATFGVWHRSFGIQTYVTRPGEETYLCSPLWLPKRGEWHHLAITGNYPNREFKLWVDGQCIEQVPLNVELTYDNHPWCFGAASKDTTHFAYLFGYLDELRIYNRSLNEDEILKLAAFAPNEPPISPDWTRDNLPDGKYLISRSENNGVPNNHPRKIELTGQIPLWQRPPIVGGSLALVFGLCLLFLRFRHRQKERLRRLELEKWKALEIERGRIARDLHDDLGSGLSAISLLSEVARQKSAGRPGDEEIQQLVHASHGLSVKIREIIWMVSSRNDRLDYLASYLGNYVVEQFEQAPFELNLRLPEELPTTLISGEQRRAFFQVFKESLRQLAAQKSLKHLSVSFPLSHVFEVVLECEGEGGNINENGNPEFRNLDGDDVSFQQLVKKLREVGGDFSANAGSRRLCLPLKMG